MEILATDLRTAADDPSIERIVLEIDSPGGQASGIAEMAAQIAAIDKPVIAYAEGIVASAAYWLASAADELIVASTAMLGSIGVVATYQPEKDGPIRVISSGSPLKQATPDTEQGRAETQRIVDELAAVFIADVASYRKVTVPHVLEQFGRGGLLVGAAAVKAGMADRVGVFEDLFTAGLSGNKQGIIAMGEKISPEITRASLAVSHPALIEEITTESRQAGVDDERARVSAILAAAAQYPQASAMANVAIAQGLSADQASALMATVPEAIAQAATSDERSEFRAALLAEGRQQVDPADTVTGTPEPPADPEQAAKAKWAGDATLRAEFGGSFDRWQAFEAAQRSGRVHILRK